MPDAASPLEFRLFIALAIPDAIKARIEIAQTKLRNALPAKASRWTRREQFHLTLKFLGNVAASRVEELTRACVLACQPHRPLHLTAQGIGFFPNARIPRVVWVGIKDSDARLATVWEALQNASQPFTKEPPETDFTGHVTLGRLNRLRRNEAAELARLAAEFETAMFGEWTADRVELMRSELSSQGARHTVLAELPLTGAQAEERMR